MNLLLHIKPNFLESLQAFQGASRMKAQETLGQKDVDAKQGLQLTDYKLWCEQCVQLGNFGKSQNIIRGKLMFVNHVSNTEEL